MPNSFPKNILARYVGIRELKSTTISVMRRTDEGLKKDPTKMMKTNNKCVLLLFLCNFFDFFVARTGPGGARPWQRGHGFVCFVFCLFVLYFVCLFYILFVCFIFTQ